MNDSFSKGEEKSKKSMVQNTFNPEVASKVQYESLAEEEKMQ
jgi:hypothetical protein